MKKLTKTTLSKLDSILTAQWSQYELEGQVKALKILKSKTTNQPYQSVLFADSTGTKVILNCTAEHLELYQNYTIIVKACRKNKYTTSSFLTYSKVSIQGNAHHPKPDLNEAWSNQVISQLTLTLKRVSPVSSSNYPVLDTEQMVDSSIPMDKLATFEDINEKKYFLRVWANDEMIDHSLLEPETTWTFNNISVSKDSGPDSNRNLFRNTFTEISCA